MKHTTKLTIIGSALACGAVLPQSSQAGGIELYENRHAGRGPGLGGVRRARAGRVHGFLGTPPDEPPPRLAVPRGLQLTYGSVEFSKDANTGPFLGDNNGGNAVGALPAGGLFFTHALSDRFTVGFGTFSYFGLAEKFDDNWVGRYYVQKGVLLGNEPHARRELQSYGLALPRRGPERHVRLHGHRGSRSAPERRATAS